MKELNTLNIRLSKTNATVGTITKTSSGYSFTYDKDYKGTPFLLSNSNNPLSVYKKDYDYNNNKPIECDHNFFFCIIDNFPEGWNLDKECNKNGFNPYSQPMRYLSLIKDDGIFQFIKDDNE